MDFDLVGTILERFGLPTLVAVWFMLRNDRRLDVMNTKLAALVVAVAVIAKTLDLDDETARLLDGHDQE